GAPVRPAARPGSICQTRRRMPQTIRLDIDAGVARITLDRPDKLNAFADDMREQLVAALDRVAAARDVNVLVIAGAGRGFCAGGGREPKVAPGREPPR